MHKRLTSAQLKALSHPTRVSILRSLQANSATLSQLGEHFETSAAHIRHHLKALQDCGLVEAALDHPRQNHLEKYYRASRSAQLALASISLEAPAELPSLTISSLDAGLKQVRSVFSHTRAGVDLQVLPSNSLDGLVLLRQGICQMATCHLLDRDTGEYNRAYVRHIFPGQAMVIIPLFSRVEGLIVQPGNPLDLQGLEDLSRPGVRFINREPGSGIRIWLDQMLAVLGIEAHQILGYDQVADSHARVAQLVAMGQADAGLGIAAQARELKLDFIPLFEEPYELVLPAERVKEPAYYPFFEHLNSKLFRDTIRRLAGYHELAASGQVQIVH